METVTKAVTRHILMERMILIVMLTMRMIRKDLTGETILTQTKKKSFKKDVNSCWKVTRVATEKHTLILMKKRMIS